MLSNQNTARLKRAHERIRDAIDRVNAIRHHIHRHDYTTVDGTTLSIRQDLYRADAAICAALELD